MTVLALWFRLYFALTTFGSMNFQVRLILRELCELGVVNTSSHVFSCFKLGFLILYFQI